MAGNPAVPTFYDEIDFVASPLRPKMLHGRLHGLRVYPRALSDERFEQVAQERTISRNPHSSLRAFEQGLLVKAQQYRHEPRVSQMVFLRMCEPREVVLARNPRGDRVQDPQPLEGISLTIRPAPEWVGGATGDADSVIRNCPGVRSSSTARRIASQTSGTRCHSSIKTGGEPVTRRPGSAFARLAWAGSSHRWIVRALSSAVAVFPTAFGPSIAAGRDLDPSRTACAPLSGSC